MYLKHTLVTIERSSSYFAWLFRYFVLTLALTPLALILLSSGAAADQYHYTNALIGDRASGMGTAYTAIADDATGLYYNPAGIVYAEGKNISASVNAYYSYVKSYKGVIAGRDWDRKSSALLPNYFGVIMPLGRVKVGFSYAVPDTIKEDQDQVFLNTNSVVGRYIINFNNEDNTYNFGPTIAMEAARNLSVGATLYLHQRRNQLIMNQLVSLNNGTVEWTNQYFETTEKGLRPVLGLMWAPVKKVSLGLTVSKTFLYDAATTNQIYCYMSSGGDCKPSTAAIDTFYPALTDMAIRKSDARRKYPTQASLGAAYFASDELLLSADLRYYSAVRDNIFGDREAVVNAALGAEYFTSASTAVRAGLYTDRANTREIRAGAAGQPEHVDIYGISGSVSSFTKNTSVTMGASYFLGDGKAQIVSGSANTQNVEAQGWNIFLSSSYSY